MPYLCVAIRNATILQSIYFQLHLYLFSIMKKSIFLTVFTLSLGLLSIAGCGEDPNKPKTREERIAEFEQKMRDTPEWLSDIKKKAEDRKVPLDTMIHLDAVFMVGAEDGIKPEAVPAAATDKPADPAATPTPAANGK
jgi:hypothetical protein